MSTEDKTKGEEVTVEKLAEQLAAMQELIKAKDTKLQSLEEAIDTDKKKMIEKRDAATEAERLALIQSGKTEEALNSVLKQFDEYKKEFNADKFKPVIEKATAYEQYVETQKKSLLEKLPEGERSNFEDMSIDKLQKIVDLIGEKDENVTIDTTKGSKKNTSGLKGKLWADMNQQERNDLTLSDPEIAKQKQFEYIRNKNTKK